MNYPKNLSKLIYRGEPGGSGHFSEKNSYKIEYIKFVSFFTLTHTNTFRLHYMQVSAA